VLIFFCQHPPTDYGHSRRRVATAFHHCLYVNILEGDEELWPPSFKATCIDTPSQLSKLCARGRRLWALNSVFVNRGPIFSKIAIEGPIPEDRRVADLRGSWAAIHRAVYIHLGTASYGPRANAPRARAVVKPAPRRCSTGPKEGVFSREQAKDRPN
jgi:hypothetical protein